MTSRMIPAALTSRKERRSRCPAAVRHRYFHMDEVDFEGLEGWNPKFKRHNWSDHSNFTTEGGVFIIHSLIHGGQAPHFCEILDSASNRRNPQVRFPGNNQIPIWWIEWSCLGFVEGEDEAPRHRSSPKRCFSYLLMMFFYHLFVSDQAAKASMTLLRTFPVNAVCTFPRALLVFQKECIQHLNKRQLACVQKCNSTRSLFSQVRVKAGLPFFSSFYCV